MHDFVVVSEDGRLVRYDKAGSAKELCRIPGRVAAMSMMRDSSKLVVASEDGGLWQYDDGVLHLTTRNKSSATAITPLPDGTSAIIGYRDGSVTLYNTILKRETPLTYMSGAVRDISLSTDGRHIAVTDDKQILVGTSSGDMANHESVDWKTIHARGRRLDWLDNNTLIAVCTDGAVWTFRTSDQVASFNQISNADLTFLFVDRQAHEAWIADGEGRIIRLDIQI